MFENVSSRVPPLNGVVAYCPRGKISVSPVPPDNKISHTDDHLIDQDTQCPPIHGRGVPMCVDDLGRDVFYRPGRFQCWVVRKWKVCHKPSVPTNEFVLKSAVQDRVSIKGI